MAKNLFYNEFIEIIAMDESHITHTGLDAGLNWTGHAHSACIRV